MTRRVVYVGDRAPITVTDWSGTKPTTRTFGTEGHDIVEVRTQADVELLVGVVPGAFQIEQAEGSAAPEDDSDSPSTASGRASRGKG
jgi:hypothetical protein